MLPDRRQPHAIFRVTEMIMVVKISQGKKHGQHSVKLFSYVKTFQKFACAEHVTDHVTLHNKRQSIHIDVEFFV